MYIVPDEEEISLIDVRMVCRGGFDIVLDFPSKAILCSDMVEGELSRKPRLCIAVVRRQLHAEGIYTGMFLPKLFGVVHRCSKERGQFLPCTSFRCVQCRGHFR